MTNLMMKLFVKKLESLQYKATLAITWAIQGTSCENIYQELGLDSVKSRTWFKHLSCMFKVKKEEAPNCLIKLTPKSKQTIRTRDNHITSCNCRTDCSKHTIIPFTLNNWFIPENNIRNSEWISIFYGTLFSFIHPVQSNIYNIFDSKGVKFLTGLCLCLK